MPRSRCGRTWSRRTTIWVCCCSKPAVPDEALQRFERALAINPDIVETRACVAHALRDLGRFDEAIAHYDEVLAADPEFADAVINRSYALLMQEDYAARLGCL